MSKGLYIALSYMANSLHFFLLVVQHVEVSGLEVVLRLEIVVEVAPDALASQLLGEVQVLWQLVLGHGLGARVLWLVDDEFADLVT